MALSEESEEPVVETNTRSFQTTGVEALGPGMGAIHLTFSVLDQVAGRPVSEVEPSKPGPRHWGQSAAWSAAVRARAGRIRWGSFMGGARRRCSGWPGL